MTFLSQIHRALKLLAVDRKQVGFVDLAILLHKEDFLGVSVIGEVLNPVTVEIETIQRNHADTAVMAGVVLLFDPVSGLEVQIFQSVEGGCRVRKRSLNPGKAFDLALGRAIPNGAWTV